MKVIPIQPTLAFANGQRVLATQFTVGSILDNLFNHVVFRYTLLDEAGQWAGEATYELNGEEAYHTWDATAEGAFNIVADGVGLTIIPQVGKSLFIEL